MPDEKQTQTEIAPKKLIIAIHGIGDQIRYETAQSVAFRFYDYYGLPPMLPVGRFYGAALRGVCMMEPPGNPNLAFAEAYWADVPRQLVDDGYTLEEAKKWARTIVARLNLRVLDAKKVPQMSKRGYQMLEAVLDEIIDAVFVLDNLTFLADRAGLFTFDLKKVLDAYLNDVQVVTEFKEKRDTIVGRLDELITQIEQKSSELKNAELYLIGHSEGSVVAFLGLLDAMAAAQPPAWISRVRGLMTIGSPIETHQILWADLWPRAPAITLKQPIVWWNYMDSGDPIAYPLQRTRDWLDAFGWAHNFDFPASHDVKFARYAFPGKAHVDYWKDARLFNHFISTVVQPGPIEALPGILHDGTPADKPGSKWWFQAWASRALPFVMTAAIFVLAVFAIYKPLETALGLPVGVVPTSEIDRMRAAAVNLPAADTFKNLVGFAWIIAAMTVAVRLPRMSRPRTSPLLWLAGCAFIFGGFYYYPHLVNFDTRHLVDRIYAREWVPPALRPLSERTDAMVAPALTVIDSIDRVFGWPAHTGDSMAFRWWAVVPMFGALTWSLWRPKKGVQPLVFIGTALLALIVYGLLILADNRAVLWPVLVGGAFFLYLWWLAALLMDLSLVWHTYVRRDTGIRAVRAMVGTPSGMERRS